MSVQTEAVLVLTVFAIICFALIYYIPNEEE
jgi:hypothetical protein